jgi:SHS2 domain-containing protein
MAGSYGWSDVGIGAMSGSDRKGAAPASHQPLEHTADLGVELDAPTLEALYAEAAIALTDTLTPVAGVRREVEREVRVEAADAELLLVDYLNELLFRFETEGLLVARAQVEIDGDLDGEASSTTPRLRLRATVSGEGYDESRHPLRSLVKAVTYHGLRVWRDGDRFRARVLFDL